MTETEPGHLRNTNGLEDGCQSLVKLTRERFFSIMNWSRYFPAEFLLLLGSALDFGNFCLESGVTTVGIKWMVQESLVKRHGLII